jgi:hypothetical protein
MKYACKDCRKKFRNESALNMHIAHVHKDNVHEVSFKSPSPSAVRDKPSRGTGKGFWSTCLASFVGSLMAMLVAGAAFATISAVSESATKTVKAVWLAAFH